MGSDQSNPRRRGIHRWMFELDRILRGEATRPSDIHRAEIKIPVVGIAVVVILLAAIYGFCMSIFALVRGVENNEYHQALLQSLASMCKVPLLFLLTLVVTFPSLYVFNALVGSKLKVVSVFKLLIASLAVNLAVLASMGPILAFFSVSTPNYPFIVLLNVVVFCVAGVLGLIFLIQTLNRLAVAEGARSRPGNVASPLRSAGAVPTDVPPDVIDSDAVIQASEITQGKAAAPTARPGPLDRIEGVVLGHHVRKVFACWIVVFGLVGAQMGWVLRPFIGSPSQPFSWFRSRDSNFFQAVFDALTDVLF